MIFKYKPKRLKTVTPPSVQLAAPLTLFAELLLLATASAEICGGGVLFSLVPKTIGVFFCVRSYCIFPKNRRRYPCKGRAVCVYIHRLVHNWASNGVCGARSAGCPLLEPCCARSARRLLNLASTTNRMQDANLTRVLAYARSFVCALVCICALALGARGRRSKGIR